MTQRLSVESKHVLASIASGKLLRCEGDKWRLIDPPCRPQTFGQVPVPASIAAELLAVPGLLTRLGPGRVGTRLGLIDLGVKDYDRARYWCCTQ